MPHPPKLIMLGTGSAFPVHSYHTCFVLEDAGFLLLADAGGGYGIIRRFDECGVEVSSLRHFFISHTHTDHILGAVWVIRAVINAAKGGNYDGKLNVYGNKAVIAALDTLCRLTLLPDHYDIMRRLTCFVDVEVHPRLHIGCDSINFFDVGSGNVSQTGFRLKLSNGREFVFLGDESIINANIKHCLNADWVVCGAFCRHADASIFKPYEKHHHTVRDVALCAQQANVKRLVLVHAEDTDLPNRSEKFAAETSDCYDGITLVPGDGDVIYLD